ncbi:fatty acid--CoA ligase family protein, partial [Streptomyces sp. NPDC058964]
AEVVFWGAPPPPRGWGASALVRRRPGATATADDLIAWSRREMANYKVPRAVEFVAELPRNASGKVVKGELRGR